jgi:hypothetical protein
LRSVCLIEIVDMSSPAIGLRTGSDTRRIRAVRSIVRKYARDIERDRRAIRRFVVLAFNPFLGPGGERPRDSLDDKDVAPRTVNDA